LILGGRRGRGAATYLRWDECELLVRSMLVFDAPV
jgi:hypothetical protein